jgi:ribosomal protein S12 methylthiotransferase accessory factor
MTQTHERATGASAALHLRADVRVEVLDAEHVLVITEVGARILTGRALAQLVGRIDGRSGVDDLAAALHPDVFPGEVYYAADLLSEQGLVLSGPAGPPEDEEAEAFWNGFGVTAAEAQARLAGVTVGLVPVPGVDGRPPAGADAIAAAVADLGIPVSVRTAPATTADAALVIAVTDHYLHPGLADLNAEALRDGRPWMLARCGGRAPWIGPLLHPGSTACWACLAERLRRNRQVEDFVARHRRDEFPPSPVLPTAPSTLRVAASMTALAVGRWLATGSSELDGALLSLDTRALESQRHPVVRRPQCPACGDPAASFPGRRRVVLAPVPPARTADAALDRTQRPEDTLAALAHQISPITGVVTALVDLGHEPGVAYNYAAGHNFSIGLDTIDGLTRSVRTVTGGKGTTAAEAKMSAVGEAIERYAGVWRGDEYTVRATYRDLAGEAVHVHDLLRFSDRQYAGRLVQRRAAANPYELVPNPFDEEQEIDWSPAWSLRDGVARYLPASYCWYGHPDSARFFFCAGDTNGCAAGSTLEEAVLHALLELIERDSVALWWYNRLSRPGVDLDGCRVASVGRAREHHDRLGRDLWALDLTADLGVPALAAISARRAGPTQDIVFGFGSHLDPSRAIARAVAEVNQFLPAVARVGRDGHTVYNWPDPAAITFWERETLESQPYLVPDSSRPLRSMADLPDLGRGNPYEDVPVVVGLLERHGLDVLVLDQTRPDVELDVARAVVPGLRHFWRRLGPGRLYDVPVAMGWLPAPLAEADLNPLSIFV